MIKKQEAASFVYALIIFLLMLSAIVYYKPTIFLYIPLLVSVAVMFLQSRVNRYAFMLGTINSVLYAIAYMKMTLYSTAMYALIVSCPLQLITFFNWNCHTKQKKTDLRKMSVSTRLKTSGLIIGGFILLYMIFFKLNSQYLFFDNSITILGIVSSVLCMLRFKEYAFLQILCNIISLITFMIMLNSDPSRIIWVINAANSIISSFIALKNIKISESEV